MSEVPIKVEPVFLDSQNRPAKVSSQLNYSIILTPILARGEGGGRGSSRPRFICANFWENGENDMTFFSNISVAVRIYQKDRFLQAPHAEQRHYKLGQIQQVHALLYEHQGLQDGLQC